MGEGAPGLQAAAGRLAARLLHGTGLGRRGLVETQIAASFPDRDAEWVRTVGADCYRHFGEEVAMLASGRRGVRRALARVDGAAAVDRLRETLGENQAAVIVTGHIGNWELAGAYLASAGVPVTAVARRQRGPLGGRLHRLREGLGIDVIDHDAGAGPVVRALRSGRCVTLVADQHAYRGAERIPFLGRPAWTRLGPARLAAAARVPLAFGALVRDGTGYVAEFRVLPDGLVESGDPVTVTREWVSYLEQAVRGRPEQYFWFHRRWKNPPRRAGR
ncbi:MAG: lysophospholipid acyltransferase family protein [Gemmatimonadota bacterium]|nr:lysophospholipid acyltransferase family protein [Gemmatimonadota bacterium]